MAAEIARGEADAAGVGHGHVAGQSGPAGADLAVDDGADAGELLHVVGAADADVVGGAAEVETEHNLSPLKSGFSANGPTAASFHGCSRPPSAGRRSRCNRWDQPPALINCASCQ